MAGAPHGRWPARCPRRRRRARRSASCSSVMPWPPAGRSRPAAAAVSSSGQRERGAKCMAPASAMPARKRSRPAQAIIAALSVHSAMRRRHEGEAVPAAQSLPACGGSRRLAATPPATTSAGCAMSGNSLRKRARLRPTRSSSVSAIAAWNEAQMSATSSSRERGDRGRRLPHRRLQAGEGEVEPRLALQRTRESRSACGSPSRAAFSTFGPPG